MKIVSDEYKVIAESLDGDARYIERITLDDGTVLTDKVEELKYSNMCNNSTNFSFGNTASAILEFKIDMPTVELQDKEIVVEQGLELADGTIEYIKLGKFKVDSAETEAFRTSYRCVDAMTYKMSTKYESQLAYPATDLDVLNEVCAQTDISLVNSDLTSHTVSKKLENYTKREIIGIIAQLQGKNAIINADGNLELLWYENADYVIDDSRIYSDRTDIIKSEINYSLGYIVSTYGSTSIRVGDGETGATISNPYMTQKILDEVFAKIGGFTFTTAEVDFYGDFRLEVGDIVSLQTDGITYVLPVMTLEHNSDGGVVTTVGSVGETATQNSVDTNGKTLNELKRSVVNSETARSIAEQAADKISFVVEGDSASEFTVTENVIKATTKKLVIRTEKGGEVVIQNGIMYVDDIFAEEITATGTITGAKLFGTYIESVSGKIGGFTITSNALYNGTENITSKEHGVYVGTNGIRTVDKDGEATHEGHYSEYVRRPENDVGATTTIAPTGIGIYSYTHGNSMLDTGLRFYKDDEYIGEIDYRGFIVGASTALDFEGNAWLKDLELEGNLLVNGETTLNNKVTLKGTLYFGEDNSKYINALGNAVLNSLKLSTNTGIDTTESAYRTLYIRTGLRYGQFVIDSQGSLGIYDATDTIKKWLIKSDINQNVTINGESLTIAPNTTVAKTTNAISYMGVKNTKREGRLLASADGYIGIWDVTKNRWLCYSDADGHFIIPNSHEIKAYGGFTAFGGTMTSTLSTQNVIPTTNSSSTSTGYTVGTSNYRYRYLYAFGSSIQTSDRNYKHSFDYEDVQRLDSFFDALKPCSYFMIGGDRKHLGFVAQDVEEAMNQNGMTIDDLSFVCKDAEYTLKDEKQPDTEENREYTLDEEGNQKYIYGLKYTELHALEVDQIQRLKTRVSDLEFALSQALARIEMLEEKINK